MIYLKIKIFVHLEQKFFQTFFPRGQIASRLILTHGECTLNNRQ